jgi:hypothetical protein
MSRFDLRIVDSFELAPYIKDLRALEASMRYPIADGADHFTIDHGTHYHPFFSEMGPAKFLLLLEDGRVQGAMAGVWRDITIAGVPTPALYLADLKLAVHLRGKRHVLDMLWFAIKALFRRGDLGGWQVVYGAAMRGSRGDVMRAMRGALHPAGLLDFQAQTLIYFADPHALAKLPASPHTPPITQLANFSPDRHALMHDTHGHKDFQLDSTHKAWPLVHIDRGPDHAHFDNLGATLRHGAERILDTRSKAEVCFSIDINSTNQIKWLASHGIEAGATCTLYAMQVDTRRYPRLSHTSHVHIATSTI